MGAVIACGVFLLIIACVGVVGTTLHHQVTLFFVSFSAVMPVIKENFRKNVGEIEMKDFTIECGIVETVTPTQQTLPSSPLQGVATW